jgi:hypothetical protein
MNAATRSLPCIRARDAGDEEIQVEWAKKETRKAKTGFERLGPFLEQYQEQDVYSVGFIPEPMQADFLLPSFMNCGGLNKRLAFTSMWFSSGGTKSVVHKCCPHPAPVGPVPAPTPARLGWGRLVAHSVRSCAGAVMRSRTCCACSRGGRRS